MFDGQHRLPSPSHPEAGFTGDPTPISYTVDDNTGETSNEATVTIDYPQAINDLHCSPVVVDVFDNDRQSSCGRCV
ncbi:hypothetical protein [Psychrobacter fjordensis]|uniref:hypothetical protein n=1 Tax=Psychrobacter fjordensis TaxID=664424 RepID=UPI0019186C49|nr:hypothetical protein [Psychrobacter fjordensis]